MLVMSYFLLVRSLKWKRKKQFQSIVTSYELVIKTSQKEKEEQKEN